MAGVPAFGGAPTGGSGRLSVALNDAGATGAGAGGRGALSVLPTKAGVVIGADGGGMALRAVFGNELTGAGGVGGELVVGAGVGKGGIVLAGAVLGAAAGGTFSGIEAGAVGVLPGIVNG